MALSIILMSLAFIITFCLTALQQRRTPIMTELIRLEDMEYSIPEKKFSPSLTFQLKKVLPMALWDRMEQEKAHY